MPKFPRMCCLALALALGLAVPAGLAADNKGVIVVANDLPITDYDITQKINLLKVLGNPVDGVSRKQILNSLVDDVVKIAEAKRLNAAPTSSEVNTQIARIAKSLKLSPDDLLTKLKGRGVATEFFRRYITAQMGFNRVVGMQNKAEVKVTDADIDRKMAEIKAKGDARLSQIMSDPRMKGITVYELMQIGLPVENNDPGLLQARMADAQVVMQQFKGCGSARAAAQGVFNVQVGKKVEADAAKLPPDLKKALDRAGAGHAVGPVRGPKGLELIALCGVRKITPPKPKFEMPTRDQVANALTNEKYSSIEGSYLKEARKRVYIEYRDPSYAP